VIFQGTDALYSKVSQYSYFALPRSWRAVPHLDDMSCEQISSLTATLVSQLGDSIAGARAGFRAQPEQWVAGRLAASLGPSIGQYANYYAALNVGTHAQLEQLFKANFQSEMVRTAYDELTEMEDGWSKLIDEVDLYLGGGGGGEQTPQPGQSIPASLRVYDLKGESIGLEDLFDANTRRLHIVLLRHFA